MKKIHSLLYYQSNQGNLNPQPRQHYFVYLILAIITLSIFIFPRFIHLDADPHPGFIPRDIGYQVDEGYKTFAPKNLLVFGKTIWHPSDTYGGWMKASPVTQWPYYYAFKTLGLELKSARLISIIYFVLFLALAFYFLNRRYSITLSLTGILLLASDPALFYFSRSTLFETAIILFLYAGILLTTRIDPDKPLKTIIAMIVIMLIATYTIKRTAIIYYFPPIVACSFFVAFNTVRSSRRSTIYITAIFLIMLSLIFFATQDLWLKHINVYFILNSPKAFLLNPMPDLTPLALLLGYSCILHLLLVKPKSLYDDIYRLSLVSIVVTGPIILSLLSKHPPRFFVPIIPACLFLTIEWFHMKPWKFRMRDTFTILQKLTIAVFFIMFSMLLLRAFEFLILRNLPFSIGDHPGITTLTLFKLFPFFLVGVFVFCYMVRSNAIRILGYLIPLLTLTSIIVGISAQAMTLLHPSYDSQTIRTALNGMVSNTESIAGDWAPFFTAEAPIRSFYISKRINFPDPEHIDKIHPNYFLSSSHWDEKALVALESNEKIQLSEPQMIGTYFNQDINIYRIKYLNSK